MTSSSELKAHWDNVYRTNEPNQLSWFETNPHVSLQMINATGVGHDAHIIDVGGGTSGLVDALLLNGYKRITVLDIAPSAIEKAKERLRDFEIAAQEIGIGYTVALLVADITEANLCDSYDVWHDRAVFHFLAGAGDRKRYIDAVKRLMRIGGHLIIGTFALDGPLKCSGLAVARYSPQTLHNEFKDGFELADYRLIDHITPANITQRFIFCHFKKVE